MRISKSDEWTVPTPRGWHSGQISQSSSFTNVSSEAVFSNLRLHIAVGEGIRVFTLLV